MLWLKNGLLVKGTDGRLINCATCPCLFPCEDRSTVNVTFSGVTTVPQDSCQSGFTSDFYWSGIPSINGAHTLTLQAFPLFKKTIPITGSFSSYGSSDGSCTLLNSVDNYTGIEILFYINGTIDTPLANLTARLVGTSNNISFSTFPDPPLDANCSAIINNSVSAWQFSTNWCYGGTATIS